MTKQKTVEVVSVFSHKNLTRSCCSIVTSIFLILQDFMEKSFGTVLFFMKSMKLSPIGFKECILAYYNMSLQFYWIVILGFYFVLKSFNDSTIIWSILLGTFELV